MPQLQGVAATTQGARQTEGLNYKSPLQISPMLHAVGMNGVPNGSLSNGYIATTLKVLAFENTKWTHEFPQYSLMFVHNRIRHTNSASSSMDIPMTKFHQALTLVQVNEELHKTKLERKGDYSIEEAFQEWRCVGVLESAPDMLSNLRNPREARALDVRPFDAAGQILNVWGPEVAGHRNNHLSVTLKEVPLGSNTYTNYVCCADGSHVIPYKQNSSIRTVPRFVPTFSDHPQLSRDHLLYERDGMDEGAITIHIAEVVNNPRYAPSLASAWSKERAATDMTQSYQMGPLDVIVDVREF